MLTAMQYKGFTWRNNPEKLNIVHERAMKLTTSADAPTVIRDCGFEYRKVTGQGQFFGADAFADLFALTNIFKSSGTGVLTLPGFEPFQAYFVSFDVIEEPGDGMISYQFEFWEEPGVIVPDGSTAATCTVLKGDTLWNISERYKVSVERILLLNPNIKNPFYIAEGMTVTLR